MFLQTLLKPAAGGLATWAVSATAGGLITVPSGGPGLMFGFLAYLLVMDFGEFLFHWAQHRVPWLWSMHSLHHSDENFNVTTTARHHWAEFFLKSGTIYLAVGLLFRVNAEIIGLYTIIGFYNYFPHMNVNVGFGRWSFLLNSPRYHRLHHSCLPEHFDVNFAALLPIFDVLFRTYREPRAGECPPTGLDSHEAPQSLAEAYAWPLGRRRRSSQADPLTGNGARSTA